VTEPLLHTTPYGEQGGRIVFLHGLFGQGRNWTGIAKALAERHRVLLVDLPDHGRSAWTPGPPQGRGFDLVVVADLIAEEIANLQGGGPFALVGHSLGGKVAMVLTLRHPELVERLAVVDISPVTYRSASEFSGYIDAMRGLDLGSLTQRSDADAALSAAVPNTTVRSFLLQNLRREGDDWRWRPNLEGLKRDLANLTAWPDDELATTPAYAGPVLWVGGAMSDYITDEYAPAMDRWFPHNRRVTIKNAGHWVHSEQPDVFGEVLRSFLR
jgi:pimeloyl-ACP methyl ester carboxylesterase